MPCFHPINAWRSKTVNASGKRGITFNRSDALVDLELKIPCGQCVGCRLERSRQWAIRCVHEASLYQKNCFITLTFNNENLPKNSSLNVRHFQLFMKRLRKKYGAKIRFFHCGEYGENFGRPHYHACIFNFDFPDKELFRNVRDTKLYISQSLQELWPFGFSTIGDVTFESAAYVARYIMKKITGEKAESHYNPYDPETGEVFTRKPEYITMSRRPGIASGWLEKYADDVIHHDFCVINDKKVRPPKYYDKIFEHKYPEDFQRNKKNRILNGKIHIYNNTSERLECRERVVLAKLKLLKKEIT